MTDMRFSRFTVPIFSKKSLTFLMLAGIFAIVSHANSTQSANLTSTSVTLSNPRLSFYGELDGNNTAGTTVMTIETASGKPSNSTNQLQEGDSIGIGESASIGSYTVDSTSPDDTFTITSAIAAGDADDGDAVIATQSSTLTVKFTTVTAVNGGKFRVLVPAVDSDANSADGIPDEGKFDYNSTPPTVTCPTGVANYTFGSATQAASSVTVGSTDYHSFVCPYTGTGAVGTNFGSSASTDINIANIINPAPASGHTAGTADTHIVIVQHLNGSDEVVDSTAVAVGVIEAVKVSATVSPSISFTVAGVSSSTSKCGTTTSVTTTATGVPFGELALGSFSDAAQTLTVTTNAVGGYSVTAIANDQLGKDGAACAGDNTGNSCIRDSAGDTTTMTHTTADEWDTTSNKGFGYSLANDDAAAIAFEYDDTDGGCDGTFCAKQFADAEDSQTAQELFSSTTVADNENVDICFRIIPDTTTAAGDYENTITYTATATF